MAINTYMCVYMNGDDLCGETIQAENKYVYDHYGVLYCDKHKAEGYVDGQLDVEEDQLLMEETGELVKEFVRQMTEEDRGTPS